MKTASSSVFVSIFGSFYSFLIILYRPSSNYGGTNFVSSACSARVCEKHGFELRIVDVTRKDILHRAVQEEVSEIKTFPTLITNCGGKVEGSFSEEQVESLLSGG
jgi:NADP-dependent 3-hydroxy acid dehydrogenase YdfG